MEVKTKQAEFKADDSSGTISGYAATFGHEHPDFYGDVIAKGAFANSIARIESEGRVLPLLWNHDSDDLKSYIGTVTDLAEDDHGLLFTATFDDTPEAQRARKLAMDGRLCKLSFAYDVIDRGEVELDDGRKANELRELDIHEVSLVMYPANPDTSVVEVKGASSDDPCMRIDGGLIDASTIVVGTVAMKSGRRNSKADEDELRAVRSLLDECAAKVDALIGDEQADDADDGDTPDADDITDTKGGADETDQPTEGGEGEAKPKGRDVEKARLEAYKGAVMRKHQTKKEGNYA